MFIIQNIINGTLIKRYKRFMVDIMLEDQSVITAHCPNSGSMLGLLDAGNKVFLSHNPNPKRKMAHTLEAIEINGIIVGVNTQNPNKIIENLLNNSKIGQLSAYKHIKREVKYGLNSRIDFLLSGANMPDCYLEVKNVTLKDNSPNKDDFGAYGVAQFPDCITKRGEKHLNELENMAKQGKKCVVLYLIQRGDCAKFEIAANIDKAYAKASTKAAMAGVEFIAINCNLTQKAGDLVIYDFKEL